MKTDVAALYVDTLGLYPKLVADWWDEERDARKYAGPLPVVAHPPCQLWVNLAALNYKRWGGEHNRPGNDGGCFASALKSVFVWGGVLKHPAFSNAWAKFNLRSPSGHGWLFAGNGPNRREHWVCEVWQSAYGPGAFQVGWFDRIKPTLGKREASATPLAFAKALVDLAASAVPPENSTKSQNPQ